MSFAIRVLNAVLRPFDLRVGQRSQFDADQETIATGRQLLDRLDLGAAALVERAADPPHLPEGAAERLRQDHPHLAALRDRYRRFNAPATQHTSWNAEFVAHEVDLQGFRGDTAYLWQARDFNAAPHYLTTAGYAATIDKRGLLTTLSEDDLFGARTYQLGDSLTLSRDLLDSVFELNFLDRHTGLFDHAGSTLLDIGAGYGRFAHRAVRALPGLKRIICTDAIAESTFLSEYYLKFRGIADVAQVVPLDEIEATLQGSHLDIAVNIHSFSEMPHAAITWWLDQVAATETKWLFVVPNAMENGGHVLVSSESDGSRRDFHTDIVNRGYRLAVKEPKYLDPLIQRHGVTPTQYWLFRREGD